MKLEITARWDRRRGGFFPTHPHVWEDELSKLPANRDVLLTVKTARSPEQHAFAWALMTKLAEACDFLHDAEDAMAYCLIKARWMRTIMQPNGNVLILPKSIAFGSVDGAMFGRILDRMVHIITMEILPGLKEGDLRREIERMLDPEARAQFRKRRGRS